MAIHGHFVPYDGDGLEVIDYLRQEFSNEVLTFPNGDYKYISEAALWGANIIYNASQLMINREGVVDDIRQYLNPYAGELNRDCILSAVLMLRFLPDIIEKLVEIDLEDPLIKQLESIGKVWHYSNIPIIKNTDGLDFSMLENDKIMLQLYSEKAARFGNQVILKHGEVEKYLIENLGIYKDQLI